MATQAELKAVMGAAQDKGITITGNAVLLADERHRRRVRSDRGVLIIDETIAVAQELDASGESTYRRRRNKKRRHYN